MPYPLGFGLSGRGDLDEPSRGIGSIVQTIPTRVLTLALSRYFGSTSDLVHECKADLLQPPGAALTRSYAGRPARPTRRPSLVCQETWFRWGRPRGSRAALSHRLQRRLRHGHDSHRLRRPTRARAQTLLGAGSGRLNLGKAALDWPYQLRQSPRELVSPRGRRNLRPRGPGLEPYALSRPPPPLVLVSAKLAGRP